jgi:hypothetical protein
MTFAFSMPIGAWHPFLPAALRSLAVQGPPVQLAVLDASGDSRVSDALDRSGIEFAYRRVGKDAGQAAAIAEGWRETNGEILAWLNADDILTPGALSQAAEALERNSSIDAVFGDSVIIDLNGDVFGRHGQVGDVGQSIAIVNSISQPSCFFRREAVDRVGGLNASLGYTMDWELWIRLQRGGACFERMPGVQSAVFWGNGTKTSELSRKRIVELFGLSWRYAGPVSAARMLLGVYTQAASESSILHRLARRSGKKRVEHAGLLVAADRNPREQPVGRIELPLINIHDLPRARLKVIFEGLGGLVVPMAGQSVAQGETGVWFVTLDIPVQPSEAVMIHLGSSGGLARLSSIAWGNVLS